jgi:hypothetical protein
MSCSPINNELKRSLYLLNSALREWQTFVSTAQTTGTFLALMRILRVDRLLGAAGAMTKVPGFEDPVLLSEMPPQGDRCWSCQQAVLDLC